MNNIILQIAPYINAISLVLGIALGLLLIFTKRANQKANRFLGYILIITVIWQCWLVATTNNLFRYYEFIDWVPFSNLLAIGPCIYFYSKCSSSNTFEFRARDFVHFIPLLLEWFVFFGLISNETLENNHTYTMFGTRFLLQLVAVISIGSYSYVALKKLNTQNIESDLEQSPDFKWLRRLIRIFALLWLVWIPYMLANAFIFNHYLSDYDVYPLHIFIWIFTFWMAAKVFLKPEIVLLEREKKKVKFKKTPSKQIVDQAHWLNEKMKAEKYYLNPELTLQSLSKELDLHANTISQTFNEGLNKSFSDVVNEYRIKAVVEKLNSASYAQFTILGIAYESGFNSKTTFNRAFKKFTGKTPVVYKKELNNN